jgi:HEAT repeat protein
VSPSDGQLVLAVGGVFLLWLGISLFVVITRALYDVRERGAAAARRALAERNCRDDEFAELVGRLPRRVVERIAAESSTPEHVAQPFSSHAFARSVTRLLRRAERHRDEGSKWRRIAALRIVVLAGAAEAEALLERALRDPDPDVVGAAVVLLGNSSLPRAAAMLVAALRESLFPSSRIAAQLDEARVDLAELLLPLVEDADPRVRFWGATLLARYVDRDDVVAALAAAARDADGDVRAAAVESLGRASGPAARATAVALLDDSVWWVRAHAARALEGVHDPELVARLGPLLADEQWWVRAAAKRSLESMGEPIAEHLLAFVDHRDAFARNGAAEVLQNVGVVDALLHEAAQPLPDASRLDLLRRILAAGGTRFAHLTLARARPDAAARVHTLLAEPAPS